MVLASVCMIIAAKQLQRHYGDANILRISSMLGGFFLPLVSLLLVSLPHSGQMYGLKILKISMSPHIGINKPNVNIDTKHPVVHFMTDRRPGINFSHCGQYRRCSSTSVIPMIRLRFVDTGIVNK